MYFDLFALNETRVDSSISDGLVNISGYDIIRKDSSRRGGGVCVYLRSSINYKTRNDLVPDGLEAVFLGAVHMSRASPANRADSIILRPMVARLI